MESTKLQFKANLDYAVKLNYDQPKQGTSQYGDWYMYSVEHEGEEKVFFATPFLHDKLKHYGKDDTITIQKMEVGGGKVEWNIFPDGETPVKRDRGNSLKPELNKESQKSSQDWDLINAKKSYDIHKQVCLKLAVGLEKEKVDYKRVGKNMDRLLAVLNNDYARALSHLASATNLFNLEAIWAKYQHIWKEILTENEFKLLQEDYSEETKKHDTPF